MQVVIDNCQYVIGGEKKLENSHLFKLIEGFGNPRELIALFLINTCELGLDQIDNKDEKCYILEKCSDYFAKIPNGDSRLDMLCASIFDAMCEPIVLQKSGKFLQIWADIIEYTSIAVEEVDNDERFPYCMIGLLE